MDVGAFFESYMHWIVSQIIAVQDAANVTAERACGVVLGEIDVSDSPYDLTSLGRVNLFSTEVGVRAFPYCVDVTTKAMITVAVVGMCFVYTALAIVTYSIIADVAVFVVVRCCRFLDGVGASITAYVEWCEWLYLVLKRGFWRCLGCGPAEVAAIE